MEISSFFLGPAVPGGAFLVERSGITMASGTPNLITVFTSPCPVRPRSRRWHEKLLAATAFGIEPYASTGYCPFQMKWKR